MLNTRTSTRQNMHHTQNSRHEEMGSSQRDTNELPADLYLLIILHKDLVDLETECRLTKLKDTNPKDTEFKKLMHKASIRRNLYIMQTKVGAIETHLTRFPNLTKTTAIEQDLKKFKDFISEFLEEYENFDDELDETEKLNLEAAMIKKFKKTYKI